MKTKNGINMMIANILSTSTVRGDTICWIQVDATTDEYDYVDAGHIRLGEKTTFQPQEMTILDYRTEN